LSLSFVKIMDKYIYAKPFFQWLLLKLLVHIMFLEKNLIILGFLIIIIRIQRPFLCYRLPFFECGVPLCLDGIFILFDGSPKCNLYLKKKCFHLMPCKILRDKKHLKLIDKIDIDDLSKKKKEGSKLNN